MAERGHLTKGWEFSWSFCRGRNGFVPSERRAKKCLDGWGNSKCRGQRHQTEGVLLPLAHTHTHTHTGTHTHPAVGSATRGEPRGGRRQGRVGGRKRKPHRKRKERDMGAVCFAERWCGEKAGLQWTELLAALPKYYPHQWAPPGSWRACDVLPTLGTETGVHQCHKSSPGRLTHQHWAKLCLSSPLAPEFMSTRNLRMFGK